MEKPMNRPAIMGAQNDILVNDVHPNQKNATANNGADQHAISSRISGGTGDPDAACVATNLT
jgi:hypothetical protein